VPRPRVLSNRGQKNAVEFRGGPRESKSHTHRKVWGKRPRKNQCGNGSSLHRQWQAHIKKKKTVVPNPKGEKWEEKIARKRITRSKLRNKNWRYSGVEATGRSKTRNKEENLRLRQK